MAGKIKNSVVWVGRLQKDTGILEFMDWLKGKKYNVDFVGDGELRKECEEVGRVHGFVDPTKFYKNVSLCVPAGYLSYIEAKSFGCKIKVFPNNKLKVDYWREIEKIKKFPTWDQVADEYLSLYHSEK